MKQAENPLLVDLALQGGGSHGAFTWGVLDRLLEESRLRIEAISGTSAGAMNAAALADGWTEGGASFEIVRLRSTSCLSACLRTMFRAVEMDGETYWDGGYAGNPTITPLIRESDARDTILVQINPRECHPGCRRFVGEYGLWRTNQALQLTNGSSCWKV